MGEAEGGAAAAVEKPPLPAAGPGTAAAVAAAAAAVAAAAAAAASAPEPGVPAEEAVVVWSPEVEVCLFHAMLGHKPVGESRPRRASASSSGVGRVGEAGAGAGRARSEMLPLAASGPGQPRAVGRAAPTPPDLLSSGHRARPHLSLLSFGCFLTPFLWKLWLRSHVEVPPSGAPSVRFTSLYSMISL